MRGYAPKDLAIVIPTKDRPDTLRILLCSLEAQAMEFGRILVIDSGDPIDGLLAEFENNLPIEYCRSLPGQIRQRKLGISMLTEATPLVATIDDDLVFEPNAFSELLSSLNSAGDCVAGAGFNPRGAPAHCYSMLASLFFMSSKNPGVVTLAGYNTSIAELNEDIESSWLGGGYSVWKLNILRQFEQEEINTRWAVGEDVRFSYRVGKYHRLIVACKAGFTEQQRQAGALRPSQAYYRGVKAAAAYYYFTKTNSELSRLACVWMLCGRMIGSLLVGFFRFEGWRISYALGHAVVIAFVPCDLFRLADIKRLMED